jgi:hypothetical protein
MRRTGAVLALLLLTLAIGVTAASGAEERTLSLSASKFGFAAEPGQKGTGEVFVINEGAKPMSVRIYAADQVVDENGSVTYVVPPVNSNTLASPALWLTFQLPADAKSTGNIPVVRLAAGQRLPVKFQVDIPEGALSGDRQAVLFFETYDPADPSGTRINARLGARIKTRVKGEVVENLSVQPFTMPSFVIGSKPDYSFTIKNEGNVDEQVTARLVVLDRSENERSSAIVVTDTAVYANTNLKQEGTLQLPGSAIGPNHVRLIVNYPGESGVAKSIEKDLTVWAAPLWLVIAAGALLVIIVLVAVWMAGRRAAERKQAKKVKDERADALEPGDSE